MIPQGKTSGAENQERDAYEYPYRFIQRREADNDSDQCEGRAAQYHPTEGGEAPVTEFNSAMASLHANRMGGAVCSIDMDIPAIHKGIPVSEYG